MKVLKQTCRRPNGAIILDMADWLLPYFMATSGHHWLSVRHASPMKALTSTELVGSS